MPKKQPLPSYLKELDAKAKRIRQAAPGWRTRCDRKNTIVVRNGKGWEIWVEGKKVRIERYGYLWQQCKEREQWDKFFTQFDSIIKVIHNGYEMTPCKTMAESLEAAKQLIAEVIELKRQQDEALYIPPDYYPVFAG